MPDLLPKTLIRRVDGLLATEVNGETVLMGNIAARRRRAHVIWDLLEAPCTFEQLCAALLMLRYAGPSDVIAADARRFLDGMAAEALVSLT